MLFDEFKGSNFVKGLVGKRTFFVGLGTVDARIGRFFLNSQFFLQGAEAILRASLGYFLNPGTSTIGTLEVDQRFPHFVKLEKRFTWARVKQFFAPLGLLHGISQPRTNCFANADGLIAGSYPGFGCSDGDAGIETGRGRRKDRTGPRRP